MPDRTIRALVRLGITHVVGIPDNTSGPLFPAVRRHPTLRLVTVTREGEAMAIGSGLWLGGASPLVVIQNTGLLESGDALRGTATRMAAPLPLLITGRGYSGMRAAGVTAETERTMELLTRPGVDSTAVLTEPTLEAWGVPFTTCEADDDPVVAIGELIDRATSESRPIACILLRHLD